MPSNDSFALSPFLQSLTLSGLILDLGCGTGLHARALARAGCRVVGLDMDLDALDTASTLAEQGETVRWIVRRVDLNEYKREQAAPGLKVTGRAFGIGRRIPIAQRYVS